MTDEHIEPAIFFHYNSNTYRVWRDAQAIAWLRMLPHRQILQISYPTCRCKTWNQENQYGEDNPPRFIKLEFHYCNTKDKTGECYCKIEATFSKPIWSGHDQSNGNLPTAAVVTSSKDSAFNKLSRIQFQPNIMKNNLIQDQNHGYRLVSWWGRTGSDRRHG